MKKEITLMRALNASLIVLFATASSLVLSGCLGTNTPATPPALINESASGTGFVATRGAGFEDMTTHITAGAIDGATIGTDGPATFTAFTNSGTGAFGFIANLPADASAGGVADTAVLPVSAFTAAPEVEFPAKTVEADVATDHAGSVSVVGAPGQDGGNILVDKFGASQSLQDSEYGIWAENGTTGGLSATAATTAGAFAVGIPTTIMPTSGTAIYNGGAAGVATNATGGGEFSGTAQLTANFAVGGGTITGLVNAIKFLPAGAANLAGNVGTMNDIQLNAGTIAGNTFAGTTAVAGAATGAGGSGANFATAGATGTFGGTFNGGLTAAEVAGTFHLTTGSGAATTNVIGAFGAHTP
jgi:hypothetical protein